MPISGADLWDILVIVGLAALIAAAYLAGGWVPALAIFGLLAVAAGLAGAWLRGRP